MNSSTRFPCFDLLRLFLACEVVAWHYFKLPMIVHAVPCFLAISGFLVLGSFERSPNWGRFLWKRACRLLPLLFATAVLCQLVDHSALAFIGAWLSVNVGIQHWNYAVWSLGCEEIAYLALAILFMVGAYRLKWPIYILAALSLAPCFMPDYGTTWQLIRWLPLSFCIGNIVYLHRANIGIPVAAMLGIGLAAFGFWLSPLISAVGVVALGVTVRPKLPSLPDLSYSLYLLHLPALKLAQGNVALAMPFLFVMALVSWFLIEKPALKMKDLVLRREPRLSPVRT